MSTKEKVAAAVDKLVDAGVKTAGTQQKLAEVSLETSRKLIHSQIELGASMIGFVSEQVRSLGALPSVKTVLTRQRAAGEAFNSGLTAYGESLRSIGLEAQSGYAAVAKDAVSAWSQRSK